MKSGKNLQNDHDCLTARAAKGQAFIQSELSALWECRIECLRIQTYSKENASSGLGRFRRGIFPSGQFAHFTDKDLTNNIDIGIIKDSVILRRWN